MIPFEEVKKWKFLIIKSNFRVKNFFRKIKEASLRLTRLNCHCRPNKWKYLH